MIYQNQPRSSFPLALIIASVSFSFAVGQEAEPVDPALILQKRFVAAIAKAEKSVVAIARVRKRENLFETSRAPDPTSPDFIPNEFGSGVIIGKDGLILTCYHVLGNPEKFDYYVWVNHKPFEVTRVRKVDQVKAGDPWSDLAVLKIEADDLQPITFGDTKSLKKGMIVIALGNPYAIARDGEVSATWGIISNFKRHAPTVPGFRTAEGKETIHHFGTLIQTDAKLPLGTSGGALVNLDGEMIGLTTSLAALAGYEKTAGFAVPVDDMFRRVVENLKQGRQPAFGFLGVSPENLSAGERRRGKFGARIREVVGGTPADEGGVEDGDVITHVNDTKVHDRDDLFRELSSQSVDAVAQLTVERGAIGQNRSRVVTLPVTLSKKHVQTRRPAYSSVEEPRWRGMRIEYATAMPPAQFFQRTGLPNFRSRAVGVIDVSTDSPAWKAGVRPGDLISHAGSAAVSTPAEFRAAVEERTDTVPLRSSGNKWRNYRSRSEPVTHADRR